MPEFPRKAYRLASGSLPDGTDYIAFCTAAKTKSTATHTESFLHIYHWNGTRWEEKDVGGLNLDISNGHMRFASGQDWFVVYDYSACEYDYSIYTFTWNGETWLKQRLNNNDDPVVGKKQAEDYF